MRTLFLAAWALTVVSLAACSRQEAATDSPAPAAAPARPPADATTPPPRSVTQASAEIGVGDAGAYGMPRAPVPYNELGAYERQWDQQARQVPPASAQPGQAPAPSESRTSKPRSADTVFY
jgi:hypothetical protein